LGTTSQEQQTIYLAPFNFHAKIETTCTYLIAVTGDASMRTQRRMRCRSGEVPKEGSGSKGGDEGRRVVEIGIGHECRATGDTALRECTSLLLSSSSMLPSKESLL